MHLRTRYFRGEIDLNKKPIELLFGVALKIGNPALIVTNIKENFGLILQPDPMAGRLFRISHANREINSDLRRSLESQFNRLIQAHHPEFYSI
jgi:hypothetical protein